MNLTSAEQYICQLAGMRTPSDNMQRLMRDLVDGHGVQREPVDPLWFMKQRGIVGAPVPESSLALGRLTPDEGGFVLGINRTLVGSRRRFTLAHELAHTFFFDLTCSPPVYKGEDSPREQRVVERLCNEGANALLLPDRLLTKHSRKISSLSLTSLRKISRAFDVSLQSCCIALERIGFWRPFRGQVVILLGEAPTCRRGISGPMVLYRYVPPRLRAAGFSISLEAELDDLGWLDKPRGPLSSLIERTGLQRMVGVSEHCQIDGLVQCDWADATGRLVLLLILPTAVRRCRSFAEGRNLSRQSSGA